MELGIHVVRFDFPGGTDSIGPTVARTVEAAEAAGVTSITVMDHYFQLPMIGGPESEMLEGYATLGFMAGHTRKARLGLLVTGVTYRHPGLLAKIVTTLDVLSGGRAELGIGAAWYEREHLGLGVPFPPVSERFERLEETLQICRQMWSDDDGPYEGRHYRLAETINVPQPISRPHPPIRIGGQGERKTLKLVAKYADACNLFAIGPDATAQKLEVLNRHCDDAGRDPDEIRKTMLYSGDVFSDAFPEDMEKYAKLGFTLVDVMPPQGDPVAWTERLAGVTQRIAGI